MTMITSDINIHDFVNAYYNAIVHRLRSYRSVLRHLRRFENYFSGRLIKSIKRRDILEYITFRQSRQISTASINVELAVYSASINFMRKNYELDFANPVEGLKFPVKPGRLRYLEKHEAARLICVAKTIKSLNLADFIELALNTGARKNELLQLQFRNVDFDRRIITIEAHTTKSGRRRYLPCNMAAMNVLCRRSVYRNQYCPESPWVFSRKSGKRILRLDNSFQLAIERAGIEDFHIHDLRHTFASWLVSEGVELIKVRDLLGHASISMTERYAHLAPQRLHDAVAVLDRFAVQGSLI